MDFVKPKDRSREFQFDDFFDDPVGTTVGFDPLGLTQMFGIQDTFWDPVWHVKKLGLADGGSVGAPPLSNPFELQAMMNDMSDQQLAQIAANPPVPQAQLLAIQALDQRKQMRMSQVQQPTTTVLEDRVAQSMPVPQSAAASDPIRSGIMAIAQQQQQQRPPQAMAGGGPVNEYLSDLQTVMPAMQQMAPGPSDAQGWMALANQFQGPDRMAPFAQRLAGREANLEEERRRNRWLALARAGLGMMGPGSFWSNLSRGGMAGLDALEDANSDYEGGLDRLLASQIGLAQAQQGRDDRASANAFSGFTGRQNAAYEHGIAAAANIGRTRESERDRAAANWRDTNDIEVLANQLFEANEGTMVQDGVSHGRLGAEVPFSRPYSRQDAIQDAILLASSRSGSRAPDDLTERTGAARALLADPMVTDQALKDEARAFLGSVIRGDVGNAGTSTGARVPRAGSGIASALPSGTVAPSEAPTAAERTAPPSGPPPVDPQSLSDFQAGRNAGDVIDSNARRARERARQNSARPPL